MTREELIEKIFIAHDRRRIKASQLGLTPRELAVTKYHYRIGKADKYSSQIQRILENVAKESFEINKNIEIE